MNLRPLYWFTAFVVFLAFYTRFVMTYRNASVVWIERPNCRCTEYFFGEGVQSRSEL